MTDKNKETKKTLSKKEVNFDKQEETCPNCKATQKKSQLVKS